MTSSVKANKTLDNISYNLTYGKMQGINSQEPRTVSLARQPTGHHKYKHCFQKQRQDHFGLDPHYLRMAEGSMTIMSKV